MTILVTSKLQNHTKNSNTFSQESAKKILKKHEKNLRTDYAF